MSNQSRRSFIKQTALVAGAAGMPQLMLANNKTTAASTDMKILFQGDSITDGNRTRDNDWNHVMGHGYAYLISSRLWYEYPEKKYHFFNRGISGNRVTNLAARWQTDTLDIKPDILSILIGVNDANGYMTGDTTCTTENYEAGYSALLKQTKAALPAVKLVICEPFILPVGRIKDDWAKWSEDIAKRQAIAKKLAVEFDAVFVGFQKTFNNALSKAPADYWIWDGVHPMPAGHELMAREWLKAVKGKLL
ncbi:SGNH/GDSL hydrolase family protein [Mucilaginibacter gynuensis]|uniref:SGNH/GDSL hydrolase family protein n=1 Tax=Mucilaginibacter gynuensis TaxID=1302236 RepID=A0ABP8FPW7_9SPHI